MFNVISNVSQLANWFAVRGQLKQRARPRDGGRKPQNNAGDVLEER